MSWDQLRAVRLWLESWAEQNRVLIKTGWRMGNESDGEVWRLEGDLEYDLVVELRREHREQWCDDDLEETIRLAHELGHVVSEREGNCGPDYLRAEEKLNELRCAEDASPLTSEEKRLVVEEEERAWDRARRLLEDAGCPDWSVFEQMRERALNTYRDGVPIDP